MKILKITLFAAVALMMASCGGKKEEAKVDSDTVSVENQTEVGFIEDMPADSSSTIAEGAGVAVD